jgi:hypothetical protein
MRYAFRPSRSRIPCIDKKGAERWSMTNLWVLYLDLKVSPTHWEPQRCWSGSLSHQKPIVRLHIRIDMYVPFPRVSRQTAFVQRDICYNAPSINILPQARQAGLGVYKLSLITQPNPTQPYPIMCGSMWLTWNVKLPIGRVILHEEVAETQGPSVWGDESLALGQSNHRFFVFATMTSCYWYGYGYWRKNENQKQKKTYEDIFRLRPIWTSSYHELKNCD